MVYFSLSEHFFAFLIPQPRVSPKVEQYCRDSWWLVKLRNCHLKLFGSNFLPSSFLTPFLVDERRERKDLAFYVFCSSVTRLVG